MKVIIHHFYEAPRAKQNISLYGMVVPLTWDNIRLRLLIPSALPETDKMFIQNIENSLP